MPAEPRTEEERQEQLRLASLSEEVRVADAERKRQADQLNVLDQRLDAMLLEFEALRGQYAETAATWRAADEKYNDLRARFITELLRGRAG